MYCKFISETQIEYPPKNFINQDGSVIINFNKDEPAMLANGYVPLEEAEVPEEPYTITYVDKGTSVQIVYTIVPDLTPAEEENKRRRYFYQDFFETSLGFIRRTVTKADGTTADFLLDYVPIIQIALAKGLNYPIIVYSEPDFTKDVEDWTLYQTRQYATEQFIGECLNQIANDFIPVNTEEE